MAASRPNRISKKNTSVTLVELIQELDDKRILIPAHQREYCWDRPREMKFIQSILKGYPIPSILMSSRRVDPHPTLEDGRQRLTAASRFRSNKFSIRWVVDKVERDLTYEGLPSEEQMRFDNETIMVQTFMHANDDDRIQIFDWHQNGAPLSTGERYHAQSNSNLISFVKELLMTPGSGYHDRASAIWDVRGDPLVVPEGFVSKDKRRKWLLAATALVMGLVYGPKNATKKYEPDRGLITAEIPAGKKAAVKKDLERILEIYEAVEVRAAATKPKKWKNAHWDLGTYTGYILYSLSALAREGHNDSQVDLPEEEKVEFEDGFYEPNSLKDEPQEWATIKATWVDYMVSVRRTINANPTKKLKTVLEEKIHKGISKARSWTNARWDDGYKRVFGIPITETVSTSGDEEESDEDSEE
jgi:hypothetical protein